MFYDYYNQDFFTKNRKLVLKEYDDDGKLLEEREFANEDLAKFLSIIRNGYEPLKVARYKALKQFTKEELKVIERYIKYMEICANYSNKNDVNSFDTEEDIKFFKDLLKMPKEKINFALELSDSQTPGFYVSANSPYFRMKFTFKEALKFIDDRPGIYYTVTNLGRRRWSFIDKPTLKQYRYQLNKNGERTVFLSFKDWKEYIVTESDLTE